MSIFDSATIKSGKKKETADCKKDFPSFTIG